MVSRRLIFGGFSRTFFLVAALSFNNVLAMTLIKNGHQPTILSFGNVLGRRCDKLNMNRRTVVKSIIDNTREYFAWGKKK